MPQWLNVHYVQVWWYEPEINGKLVVTHLGTGRGVQKLPVPSPITCLETCAPQMGCNCSMRLSVCIMHL